MTSPLLAEMTWLEADAAAKTGAIALVPVGSTEAHGPHLPLSTDVIISEELSRRVAAAIAPRPCVIAPSIAYALTEYAGEFGGTLSLSRETATALVRDVCVALIRRGFARVALVNNHLEPDHVATLRDAIAAAERATGARVCFPDCTTPRWGRTLSDEFKRGDCHAGSYETSLVLAARASLVRDAARRSLPAKTLDFVKQMKSGVKTFKPAGATDAYFGDPAAATAAEGETLYARLVTMVTTEITETWP